MKEEQKGRSQCCKENLDCGCDAVWKASQMHSGCRDVAMPRLHERYAGGVEWPSVVLELVSRSREDPFAVSLLRSLSCVEEELRVRWVILVQIPSSDCVSLEHPCIGSLTPRR